MFARQDPFAAKDALTDHLIVCLPDIKIRPSFSLKKLFSPGTVLCLLTVPIIVERARTLLSWTNVSFRIAPAAGVSFKLCT